MRPEVFGAVLTLTASVVAAQVQPMGPTFQVNTHTTHMQAVSHVASDASGNFAIVWQSYDLDGSSWNVYGRRYDASGSALGPEFRVNSHTTGPQEFRATVAFDGAGNHTVVWGSSPWPATDYDVKGQRYDSAGNPLGTEFQVNSANHGWDYQPSIAANPAGDFAVVWHSFETPGSGIYGRRYDAAGVPVGSDFLIDGAPTGNRRFPRAAADGAGGFGVAWWNFGTGPTDGVALRAFSATNGLAPEVQVASACGGTPSIARLGTLGFVIGWVESHLHSAAGHAQLFGPSGAPLTPEFEVVPALQGRLEVLFDAYDRFVVIWHDAGGLAGRAFNARGVPITDVFPVTPSVQYLSGAASQSPGAFVVTWADLDSDGTGIFARRFGGVGTAVEPRALRLDAGGNGVLEPGETVAVVPGWHNPTTAPVSASGTFASFTGPAGPTYSITDASAQYLIPPGQDAECLGTGDCYALAISGSRPALHWDGAVTETLATGAALSWPIHVGASFADVARTRGDYPFVEALFHHGVTAGCAGGAYCPDAAISREQVAVFIRLAREGAIACPPGACTPGSETFTDVPASGPYCRWIEELARIGAAGGCGSGRYCPAAPVTREQMAVLILRARSGPVYIPPACVPGSEVFGDVPAASSFCPWIEELARRNVVTGCGGGNYCPGAEVTRGQMAVFLGVTFGLSLYGP